MKRDPGSTETVTVKIPPQHGPGSGKDAWRTLAINALNHNDSLSNVIARQRETVLELQAEIALLRNQIARRKPLGSHTRLSDDTVAAIEHRLAAGHTTRTIGVAYNVSAMTVSRIRKRVEARKAQVRNINTVTNSADVTMTPMDAA